MSPVPAVIVPPDLHGDWLNPATDDENEVRQLLETIPEPHLPLRVVDKAVGNVRAHVDRMPEFPGVYPLNHMHPLEVDEGGRGQMAAL